jgi:hypothetical protein
VTMDTSSVEHYKDARASFGRQSLYTKIFASFKEIRPFTMSTTQEKKQAFIEHKVITDVLPGNLDLLYDLTVKWPNALLDKPGVELGREDTQPEPTLFLNPPVSRVTNSEVLRRLTLYTYSPLKCARILFSSWSTR